MIADTLQAEFYRRGWPEKYREATPKEKGEWVRLGGGAPAFIGRDGKITKACPGMKGETVKGITGESDESREGRKARQDVADQHGVKGDEVTAEQARGLTQEHKEEPAPWDQPEPQQPKKSSINPKTRFGAAVLETANEWGVAPDDLADACQFVYEEKARQSQARESAKSHARQITGLTQRDIGRLTNAGYDYTSARHVGGPTGDKLRQFDVWATEVARQHPGLIGNADDPNADLGAGLWDLIAEGRQVVPPIYDPGVMREAATLALANRGDTGGAYEFETAGSVPFARSGMVERYRRWMFARENQYRRVVERFTKWEESKHPRADDGKFGERGGGATTTERPKATDTPEFKKWFGDSKVVDESGEPLRVYHGTKETFDIFDPRQSELSPRGSSGTTGFMFTSNPQGAGHYAGSQEGAHIKPVYLAISNPYTATPEDYQRASNSKKDAREWRQELIDAGYDGIFAPHLDEYIAFSSIQIKSATGNQGTFDPNDPRINYQRSTPMQEQSYPPINPVEVEHYDKDSERAKDHDVSPDIKAQIRELKESEEELLSGIDKSDAPSNKGKKKE